MSDRPSRRTRGKRSGPKLLDRRPPRQSRDRAEKYHFAQPAWPASCRVATNGRGGGIPPCPGLPKVALLIETSRGYGRALLRGIVRYSRLNGPWSFYVTPGDFEQVLPRMRSWGGTGIIARIETPEVARAILASGLPTIALDLSEDQLRRDHRLSRLSEVASDSRGAARMAAEHLLERGCAIMRSSASGGGSGRRREEGFCDRVREAGHETHFYVHPGPRGIRSGSASSPSWCGGSRCPTGRPDGLQRRPRPRGPGGLPGRRAPRSRRMWPWSGWTTTSCSASSPTRRSPALRSTPRPEATGSLPCSIG